MSYPINGKIVFVNWTPPYFDSKNMTGYRKLQLNEIYSLDLTSTLWLIMNTIHIKLIMKVQHSQQNYIQIEMDLIGIKNNLLNLFDEIDFEVLENYKQNYDALIVVDFGLVVKFMQSIMKNHLSFF